VYICILYYEIYYFCMCGYEPSFLFSLSFSFIPIFILLSYAQFSSPDP